MTELQRELQAIGWRLSEEGLTRCLEACQENQWKQTCKNIAKTALNLDLRAIGVAAVSPDVARNLEHSLEGPLVLQLQKVKNVAAPSAKQLVANPGRRLLRLQLTDGHTTLSAVEMEGAVQGLSPLTPPGSKVRLTGSVTVQNGFLLLKKTTRLEFLGGEVEHLIKKFNLQKAVPDNIDRSRLDATSGPPPFVSFKESASAPRTQAKKETLAATSQPPAARPNLSRRSDREDEKPPPSSHSKTSSQKQQQRQPFQTGRKDFPASLVPSTSYQSRQSAQQTPPPPPLSAAPQQHRRDDEYRSQNRTQPSTDSGEQRATRGRGRGRGEERSSRGRYGGRRQAHDDDGERSEPRGSRSSRHSRREADDTRQASSGIQLADFFEQKLRINSVQKHEPVAYDEYQEIDEDLAMELTLQASAAASTYQQSDQHHHSSSRYKSGRRYEADFSRPTAAKGRVHSAKDEERFSKSKQPLRKDEWHYPSLTKDEHNYPDLPKKTTSKPPSEHVAARQEHSHHTRAVEKDDRPQAAGHSWDWVTTGSAGGAPMGATKQQH